MKKKKKRKMKMKMKMKKKKRVKKNLFKILTMGFKITNLHLEEVCSANLKDNKRIFLLVNILSLCWLLSMVGKE
jgi:hypothetical protein